MKPSSRNLNAEPIDANAGSSRRERLRWAVIEVFWIVLIFFLFAGSPPPDVGESHYLTKAKQYWNPQWCAGDLFLESADAHQAFCWTFGWVTQFASLTASAWIGRIVAWTLLAWAWQRLSTAVVPGRLNSLLTAGLMLMFLRRFHMAGEWIVGGVEAKCFAYVFVLLALENLVRSRWRAAWLFVGGASALHVLVGGWSAVALGFAWIAGGRDRYPLKKMWPAVVGGLLLSLPGVVPALALTRGVDEQIVAEANRIYVFERLSHHLVFHRFDYTFIARNALLLLAWLALAWKLRSELNLRRLNQFIAGALVIAAAGILIDQVVLAGMQQVDLAAKLLRYYWFRMSDAMLPIGVALSLVLLLKQIHVRRPAWASGVLMVLLLVAGANLAEVCYQRSQRRIPGGFLQPRPLLTMAHDAKANKAATELFQNWRDVCYWIRDNTPGDAKVLTPRRQQTFKWYAERAEVANWKDVPQDAAGLVEWRETMAELFPRERGIDDLAEHSDPDLLQLARKHGTNYILIDRTRTARQIALPRVYPVYPERNVAYEVYLVPAAPRAP